MILRYGNSHLKIVEIGPYFLFKPSGPETTKPLADFIPEIAVLI